MYRRNYLCSNYVQFSSANRLNTRLFHFSVDRWRAVLPTVCRSSQAVPWLFFSQDTQRLPFSNYRKSHEFVLGVLVLRLIAPVSCGRRDKVCICHKHTLSSPCIGKFLQFTRSFRDAFFFPEDAFTRLHLLKFSLMLSRTEGRRGSPWGLCVNCL